ncbi:MAG: redox-regulated ATPase YchF [Acidimicrobiales bacterium]
MERFGFVGLPNAGKSSLYNALTGGGALAAPYAFATTDPNVGVAKVFDHRLDALAAMSRSKSVVPASVQFNDIGGLVEGASKGEGLGNKFLGGIREVDAIVFVLRAFRNDDVPGPQDPLEHLRILELELTYADLETVESQVDKKRKALKGDRSLADEVAAAEAALSHLEAGTPLYRSDLSADHRHALRPWFLLTNKPVVAVVNLDEEQLADVDAVIEPIEKELLSQVVPSRSGAAPGVALGGVAPVFGACIQLEAEAAQLDPADRAEMLDAYDLGEGALPRFIRAAYHALGLRTFLTTGEKESRAWTFREGSTAPVCAGHIHSDLQRGFIRADTIRWDELLACGSWARARDEGKVRSEGKDYVVADGDVLEIKFSV